MTATPGSGFMFYLVNQADPSRGGFFPAPGEYTADIPRRGMDENVAGGPKVTQAFPTEETDRVIVMTGTLRRNEFDFYLRRVHEAPTTLCEFSDGENYWEVIVWVLTGPVTPPNLVVYTMELKICRKLVSAPVPPNRGRFR